MPHHSPSNHTRKRFLRLFRTPTDANSSHRNRGVVRSCTTDAAAEREHRGTKEHPHYGLFNHTRHEKAQDCRADKANITESQQQHQQQEPIVNSAYKPPRLERMGNIHQATLDSRTLDRGMRASHGAAKPVILTPKHKIAGDRL
ncbi:hypothetical protein TSMEX_011025 [Taenia solium]|eukprot:TsM_000744600 transcript=TsM_000744600 gene=TsM_000744600